MNVPEPNYIFAVSPSATADEKFVHLQNNRDLLYAYHGSRLENFYSILHNGLASHMNKVNVLVFVLECLKIVFKSCLWTAYNDSNYR